MSLSRRFTWASAARLLLLTVLFTVTAAVNVRGEITIASYTAQVSAGTLCVAFALSAIYAWFLRKGQHLGVLVTIQLILDQAIWTAVVYLSGGATSGATSFYGISCLFGAVLAGFRGAAIAGVAAGVCYTGLVVALATGTLQPPPDQPVTAYLAPTEELVYSGLVNLLVLVVVALLAGNLTERLRAAGGQLVRAEARVVQAEREASLGRLAAGLAHEIRNPLGSISGSIRMLRRHPGLGQDDRVLCDIVDHEAQRLNELVSDMLNLSKRRTPEHSQVDLTVVSREVVALAGKSWRGAEDVQVTYHGPRTAVVSADGSMLRQMLWNLVRNAVQASSAGNRVEVIVSKEAEHGVRVAVRDHGTGLDPTASERLFDAFYSTRSHGTGIGLAVVKRIVDDHGWRIIATQTDGGGATFTVSLGMGRAECPEPISQDASQRWTLFPERELS